MPNDNIDRAIQRGVGGLDGTSFSEVFYEGYGPGGVAVMLHTLTDNRNRTAGELRHRFRNTVETWVKVAAWPGCLSAVVFWWSSGARTRRGYAVGPRGGSG